MNIDLIAKLKTIEEFKNNYKQIDAQKMYDGKSLLFYSLSNSNLDSRYEISNILLKDNVDVLCKNSEYHTVLHVLLGQVKNNIKETSKLCKRFIDLGVDINAKDKKGQTALYYIIRMKQSDEELNELYEIWFSQPNLDLACKDVFGKTVLEYAKMLPYRLKLVERIKKYE